MANTPPKTDNCPFAPNATTIYVPCEKKGLYLSNKWWGKHHVICISCSVSLSVNDNSFGIVEGAGEYRGGSTVTLVATPKDGYKFVKWNDGDTQNPRIITVESDVDLEAIFGTSKTISLSVNNSSYGSVYGAGEYVEGTTVRIMAFHAHDYRFVKWDDGNTQNPRDIIVTADQNYMAIFEKISTTIPDVENGTTITISNNQILVNGEAPAFVVTISGKKIANKNLKSGVYFVSVEGETVKVSVQ